MNSDTLPDKAYFRPDEVARYFSVSKSAIYLWINEGRLQSVRVAGSVVRIRREDIMKIVRENVS